MEKKLLKIDLGSNQILIKLAQNSSLDDISVRFDHRFVRLKMLISGSNLNNAVYTLGASVFAQSAFNLLRICVLIISWLSLIMTGVG